MSAKTDSGHLAHENGIIAYQSDALSSWSLPISSIRLIGEYTNESGPFLDDHFLVFLTDSHHEWHQASCYAEGRDALLEVLEEKFPGIAEPGLCNSTTFKSRVLWPVKHLGKELFTFSKITSGGFFGRLLSPLHARTEQHLVTEFDEKNSA